MIWIAVGGTCLLLLVWFLWRAYVHPQHALVRQAANMDWVYSRTITDRHGLKNTCVTRGGLDAIVTYDPPRVVLLIASGPVLFADFVELERWLAASPGINPNSRASARSTTEFDPTILADFDRELERWPADQASAAVSILHSTLSGGDDDLRPLVEELSPAQIEALAQVVRRIRGGGPVG